MRKPHRRRELTKRDVEVLTLSSQGMRTKDIAEALKISCFTVNTHVRNIYDRLGTKSLVESFAKWNESSSELIALRRLFLDEKSPAVKWHKTEHRQPVNKQQVLMKYNTGAPIEGYYISAKWFDKEMEMVEPPVEWADASLASFESEVAA